MLSSPAMDVKDCALTFCIRCGTKALDKVHVTYSYRQHCMVSLSVGDVESQEEWHLPTYDPRNEQKYHYKLHSLDIYFWTQDDALAFVNGVRRVLPPNQVDVQDEPAPPQPQQHHHHQPAEVSAVVQQLEKAAISDSQLPPPPPPPQTNASNGNMPSFAPPPLSAVSAGYDNDGADSTTSPASFAPIAYNPAAPPAPEQIQHREKTPPPDDGELNPLHARLLQDAGTPFSPGLVSGMPSGLGPLSPGIPPPQFQHPTGAPSFPAPPLATPGLPPQGFGVHGQQQHPGLARAATMPVQQQHHHYPGMPTSPALQSPYGGVPQPFTPHSPAPPYTSHQPQIAQQHGTPTPPIASPGLPPPPGSSFSNYSYSGAPAAGNEYAIHQQAYRPMEGEQSVKYGPKKEVRGRLEENAGRLEKGVTGMLKRFEKKFG